MATYYYHTDRVGRLSPGQVITLSNDAARYQTDRARTLLELFPEGVSRHGIEYLLEDQHVQPKDDVSGMIEMFAEMVRRTKYPTLPSRFESFFAWHSLDDLRRFANNMRLSQPTNTAKPFTVWEVEAKSGVFESDMNRLGLGACWLDMFTNIDAYWRQEYSDDPLIEVLLSLPVRIVRQVPHKHVFTR